MIYRGGFRDMNTPSLSQAAGTQVSITQAPLNSHREQHWDVPGATGGNVGNIGNAGNAGGAPAWHRDNPGARWAWCVQVWRFQLLREQQQQGVGSDQGWGHTHGCGQGRGPRGAWLTCMQQLSMIMVSNLILG